MAVRIEPAVNAEPRRPVSVGPILLLHYTGMSSGPKAVDWLAREESRVSCHYVVDADGTITQLVPELYRAWHAGQSFWAGETDINSASIGIEIQNPGHEDGYPDFGGAQMAAVIALARDIVLRQSIAPEHVLAHSDVAPGRKIDPGEKFSWAHLASCGIGLWVAPVAVSADHAGLDVGAASPIVASAQALLRGYGYNAPQTGILCAETVKIVAAFQRHFRPARVDGRLDPSTLATLRALTAERDRRAVAVA